MAITGTLRKPLGAGKKIAYAQAAITGNGTVTTGLVSIDVGSAQATVQNSSNAAVGASAGPSTVSIVSIAGGVVTVVVTNLFTAPVIATQAQNIGVLATGQ